MRIARKEQRAVTKRMEILTIEEETEVKIRLKLLIRMLLFTVQELGCEDFDNSLSTQCESSYVEIVITYVL